MDGEPELARPLFRCGSWMSAYAQRAGVNRASNSFNAAMSEPLNSSSGSSVSGRSFSAKSDVSVRPALLRRSCRAAGRCIHTRARREMQSRPLRCGAASSAPSASQAADQAIDALRGADLGPVLATDDHRAVSVKKGVAGVEHRSQLETEWTGEAVDDKS